MDFWIGSSKKKDDEVDEYIVRRWQDFSTFHKDIKEEIQNWLEIVFGDNGILESVNGFRIVNLVLHFCKHN